MTTQLTAPVPWLSADEERLWRQWLRLNALLPAELHRELQRDGLSLPDFDVLVQLTDRPDGRVRISDLARQLTWERSSDLDKCVPDHIVQAAHGGRRRRVCASFTP